MSTAINMNYNSLKNIIIENNMKTNFVYCKTDPRFKAVYQNYEWCYQKFMIEGLNHDEMALEANCSKRVVEKWCCEKHRLTQKYRQKHTKLNSTQKDLIIGSLIGDGHIDKREGQSLFIVSHAENQKDYLFWKYELLKNLCNKKPSYIKGSNKIFSNGKSYKCQPSYRLCTRIYDVLEKFKKMSTSDIIKNLNKFSLSVFMLDDGYRNEYSWEICVANFSDEEKHLFLKVLKDNWGIVGNIVPSDHRYIVYSKCNKDKIDEIILSQIPNDLDIIKYKILDKRNSSER